MAINDNDKVKIALPPGLFEELEKGLRDMFSTSVDRHDTSSTIETRKAGIQAANALMDLHRNFEPSQ